MGKSIKVMPEKVKRIFTINGDECEGAAFIDGSVKIGHKLFERTMEIQYITKESPVICLNPNVMHIRDGLPIFSQSEPGYRIKFECFGDASSAFLHEFMDLINKYENLKTAVIPKPKRKTFRQRIVKWWKSLYVTLSKGKHMVDVFGPDY